MNPYFEITKLQKKNATAAQEALQKGYLELCRIKNTGSISVTELCEKSHVARTTFYANYTNTDALLEEIEDSLIVDLLKVNNRFGSFKKISEAESVYMRNMMTFSEKNKETLYTLLISRPDMRLINKWKDAVKYHFWELVYNEVGQKHCEIALEAVATLAVTFYTWYVKHPEEVDMMVISKSINSVIKSL